MGAPVKAWPAGLGQQGLGRGQAPWQLLCVLLAGWSWCRWGAVFAGAVLRGSFAVRRATRRPLVLPHSPREQPGVSGIGLARGQVSVLELGALPVHAGGRE